MVQHSFGEKKNYQTGMKSLFYDKINRINTAEKTSCVDLTVWQSWWRQAFTSRSLFLLVCLDLHQSGRNIGTLGINSIKRTWKIINQSEGFVDRFYWYKLLDKFLNKHGCMLYVIFFIFCFIGHSLSLHLLLIFSFKCVSTTVQ